VQAAHVHPLRILVIICDEWTGSDGGAPHAHVVHLQYMMQASTTSEVTRVNDQYTAPVAISSTILAADASSVACTTISSK
jgi:hypothetical protein